MRFSLHLLPWPLAAYLSATVLAGICWLDASAALAGNAPAQSSPPLPTPNQSRKAAPTPKSVSIRRPDRQLTQADEIATLHAIHIALTSVGDGGAYVWRRGNGKLRALIRPTSSFKTGSGQICRHMIVKLTVGRYTRQTEGIACRDKIGGWSLSG